MFFCVLMNQLYNTPQTICSDQMTCRSLQVLDGSSWAVTLVPGGQTTAKAPTWMVLQGFALKLRSGRAGANIPLISRGGFIEKKLGASNSYVG